jgi:hypothetical protein
MGRIHTLPNGQQVHTGGRKRPLVTPATHPHLFKSIRRYLAGGAALPAAPDAYDYFAPAGAAENDILGNDTLGDCTAAGACHLTEVFTASGGSPVVLQKADAIQFYSLTTGYNPADPSTDQGGDEVSVCQYWQQNGIDGKGNHKIAGFVSIDPTDWALVKSCGWLFEGLYLGLELDASWPQQAATGATWHQGTPDPEEGHCIVSAKAEGNLLGINTWGILMWLSEAACAKFLADSAGGNLFAILSQDAVNRAQGKAPNGLDWAGLCADFGLVGGTATGSTPPPPPSTPAAPLSNPPSTPLGPAVGS